jgi:cytochrome c556
MFGFGRSKIAALAVAGTALTAGVAWAAVDAAAVEQARAAHYKEIGKNFKAVRDQLKSGSPDLAVIRPAAHRIAELAPQVPTWFPAGSGPAAGIKTEAREDIWSHLPEFKAKAQTFADKAKALDAVAAKGDVAGLGPAATELGQACKSCHEQFRKEDH